MSVSVHYTTNWEDLEIKLHTRQFLQRKSTDDFYGPAIFDGGSVRVGWVVGERI